MLSIKEQETRLTLHKLHDDDDDDDEKVPTEILDSLPPAFPVVIFIISPAV
jgi:hypothetical protein